LNVFENLDLNEINVPKEMRFYPYFIYFPKSQSWKEFLSVIRMAFCSFSPIWRDLMSGGSILGWGYGWN
jgi:hypothetical protein